MSDPYEEPCKRTEEQEHKDMDLRLEARDNRVSHNSPQEHKDREEHEGVDEVLCNARTQMARFAIKRAPLPNSHYMVEICAEPCNDSSKWEQG